MKNNRFNFKKFVVISFFIFQIIGMSLGLVFSIPAALAADDALTPAKFTPQVSVPGSVFQAGVAVDAGKYDEKTGIATSNLAASYIIAWYNYGLAIAGVLATLMLMAAGVIWLTSGGDSGKIGQAKDLISGSIVGVIILFCAWVILNTINPNLTKLSNLEVPLIKKEAVGFISCCNEKTGGLVTPILIQDGKKVFASGENKGKPIKCGNGYTECSENKICTNEYGKYACREGVAISAGEKSGFRCCEYKTNNLAMDYLRCATVSIDTNCPSPNSGYSYIRSYTNFSCGNKDLYNADNCKAGDCTGIKDAEKCPGISGGDGAWCYGGTCWVGNGDPGEPCGNDGNSVCLKSGSTCSDKDVVGGRNCSRTGDSFCCHTK